MQKEREIQEDFYENLEDCLMDGFNARHDFGFSIDKYTGVIAVEKYSDDGSAVLSTRYFRLVPCKDKP